MLVSTPDSDQVAEFLSFFLNSAPARAYFDTEGWGTAQMNISVPILQQVPICVPPKEEQASIVRFVQAATERLDRLMDSAEGAVAALKELRTAIMSAAVTGQID